MRRLGVMAMGLCLGGVVGISGMLAQTTPGSSPTVTPLPASKPANSTAARRAAHSKRLKAQQAAQELSAQQMPMVSPKPPPPDWPANDQAKPASVGWNGRDLSILATNASLGQILRDVSTATGVKVEGFGADQRVFGSYGPAGARDVIAELMEGSGYNVLIIGDKGEGTPRQLVLTTKAKGAATAPAGGAQPNQNGEDEAVEEPEPPPEQPQPDQSRRPLGGPPQPGQSQRTPQQMMQELQQRQQQQQMANPVPPAPQ